MSVRAPFLAIFTGSLLCIWGLLGVLVTPVDAQTITIDEARSRLIGSQVTVDGTVTRAYGGYVRIQDESGPTGASAILVRQTFSPLADQFQADIEDGTIGPGTVLRVTGSISSFSGTIQINNDDLNSYEVVGENPVPSPQEVTLSEIVASGEDYESELIRLTEPVLVRGDYNCAGTFEERSNYIVENSDGTSAGFFVAGSNETQLIGTPIPTSQLLTYTGILDESDETYELRPIRTSAITGLPTPVTLEGGAGVTPDPIAPGVQDGLIGRFAVRADARCATLTTVTFSFSGRNTGVGSVELWSSDDETFGDADDELLQADGRFDPSTSTPETVTFDFRGRPIGETKQVFFLSVDLTESAGGELTTAIAELSNVPLDVGELTNPAGDFPLPLSDQAVALPIELASFEGRTGTDGIQLTWTTASETQNAGFEVQRRIQEEAQGANSGWIDIGFVEGAGTTSEPQSYRFADPDVPYAADSMSYRLRQVDTDGSVSITDPIRVLRERVATLELFGSAPNPARQQASIRYGLPERLVRQGNAALHVYDVMGRQVRSVKLSETAGRHTRVLDVRGLASGTYLVQVTAGGEARSEKMMVIR